VRALQIDHRAVTAAGDMYVGGAMIVEVDRDAQAIKAEDVGTGRFYQKPKRLARDRSHVSISR
jgi:hypothetical protein